jgi:hypothetical protein
VAKKPGTFTGKDDPRRNNGGIPKAVRELRASLEGDGPEIHRALMELIRGGNAPATIYAHTQLIGKPKERVELSTDDEASEQRPTSELLAIGLGALLAKRG